MNLDPPAEDDDEDEEEDLKKAQVPSPSGPGKITREWNPLTPIRIPPIADRSEAYILARWSSKRFLLLYRNRYRIFYRNCPNILF